jgi:hypothetical protein
MTKFDDKRVTDRIENKRMNMPVEPLGVVADFMLDLFRDLDSFGTSALTPEATFAGISDSTCDVAQANPMSGQRSWKSLPRGTMLIAVVVAILSAVSCIGMAQALATTRSKCRTQEQTLSQYDIANRLTERTTDEENDQILVRHIDPEAFAFDAVDEQRGFVTVTARNVKYVCTLQWTVNGKTQSIQLPTGESTMKLPMGRPVTLYCRPDKTAGWIQTVQVWLQRGEGQIESLGSALGNVPLFLQDGDEVIVFFEEPVTLWNAVTVPIGDETIMVTLERPQGMRDVDKWLAGEWDAREEFPNVVMFYARDGSAGLASELAAYFIANRNDPTMPYAFRGRMHTSLVTFSDGKTTSLLMKQVTQVELERVLFEAFEQLREKKSPLGVSIQEEIERVAELLKLAN